MTLFPEWQKQHEGEKALNKNIRAMQARYGPGPEGVTCKNCVHLRRFRQGARWMKCGLSRITGGAGTDWRAGWPACGRYEEANGDKKTADAAGA